MESVSVSGTPYGDCPRKHQNPYLELSPSTKIPLENIKNRKEPFGETGHSYVVSSSASEGTEGIDRARFWIVLAAFLWTSTWGIANIHTNQVIHRIMTIIDMNEEAMNTITHLPDCVPGKLGTITKARGRSSQETDPDYRTSPGGQSRQRMNEHAQRTDHGTARRQSSKAREVETISRRPDHRSRAVEPGRRSRRQQAEAKEMKELSAFFTGRADGEKAEAEKIHYRPHREQRYDTATARHPASDIRQQRTHDSPSPSLLPSRSTGSTRQPSPASLRPDSLFSSRGDDSILGSGASVQRFHFRETPEEHSKFCSEACPAGAGNKGPTCGFGGFQD
ncbi:hypothetical protein NCU02735 [Neurospora crassa OR74A]|uniref:Uncharacterized protein n=1 Tax=Neurospora crassa (strain ATCC 24698 / 74-OR23-1A / CBS 708.71 / DSM 1257 / FGSC 987) TaxID=367110 RepID=Q7SGB4_NEUCR|nr:hypothetical protein NCU02735 [Neurospora crassa OR74A]EAA35884.3 hypothetical protein NCU02735 [Neurospora crassa OR74A]|eukprot:XP_965120.3 hypothetical protein NCU02735 [Neurospora crassa OR74A]